MSQWRPLTPEEQAELMRPWNERLAGAASEPPKDPEAGRPAALEAEVKALAAEVHRLKWQQMEQERAHLERLVGLLRVWANAASAAWNQYDLGGDGHMLLYTDRPLNAAERALKTLYTQMRQADLSLADLGTPLELWLAWQAESETEAVDAA